MHAAEAMATKNPHENHLLPTYGKSHHPKSLWYGTNRTPAARSKKPSTMSQTNKRGGNNRKTGAVCQQNKRKTISQHYRKPIDQKVSGGPPSKVKSTSSLRYYS